MSESKNSPTVRIFADLPADVHKKFATLAAANNLRRQDVYRMALEFVAGSSPLEWQDFCDWTDGSFQLALSQEPTP